VSGPDFGERENFAETARHFGADDGPIILTGAFQEAKAMSFQQRENSGSLFRDTQKAKPNDRDFSGSINVRGEEFWVSGWTKETKAGKKYLSLAIKPKQAAPETTKPSFNDAIEF
jgi:hypothetical protein